MNFQYKIDGKVYDVLVVKKNNKNTYIRIKDDLTILVTTNYLATKGYVKRLLDDEKDYLRSALDKMRSRIDRSKQFYYLGKKYDIIFVDFDGIEITEDKIYVRDEKFLDKWLKNQALSIFKERLLFNYNLFEEDIPFPSLKIRKMKTRWGVCNKRNLTVTLNFNLIYFSLKEIDYVIIHELSHLVYFDHSKYFWGVVSKYMPDYKDSIKVLNG